MKTDKDRPSTWVTYRDGLCGNCYGSCCTMPVEISFADLVRLGLTSEDERTNTSEKKIAKRLQKEGIIKDYRGATGFFTLTQQANDDCYFLGKDRLCKVYDLRPGVCRQFPAIGPRPGFCPHRLKSPTGIR